jgi:PPOX class probable F420-dependent enzyme
MQRVEQTGHGVLATIHRRRGVDAVPVVFAVHGDRILLPVDTVKPKRSTDLQRVRNLEADPRCVLLVDHYSENWDDLWWVRVHGSAYLCSPAELEHAGSVLSSRHIQYRRPGSIAGVISLVPEKISGWTAGGAG